MPFNIAHGISFCCLITLCFLYQIPPLTSTSLITKAKAQQPIKSEQPDAAAKTNAPPNKMPNSVPNAILILDGSGSMWGKIKDGHKIMISRRAIATTTRPFEDKINLGLISYGHRRRGACQDVQTLLPPKSLNPDQFSRQVNRIKPLGKTPITSSLEQASDTLLKTKTGGSIILLADGPENCQKNPCDLITQDFAKKNNIIIHVIAFSMEEKDAKSLQCLAKNSGGIFTTPTNHEELVTALNASLTASIKGVLRQNTPPVIAKKKKLKPEISMTAHLGPNSATIDTGIKWIVQKLNQNEEADKDLPPWQSDQKNPKFDLTPGKYRITADFDEYQITRNVTLAKEQQRSEKFIFNLSQFTLPASWAKPDSRSGFGKLLLEEQQSQQGAETASNITIINLTDKPQTKLIPAGAYKIVGIDNGKMQNWFIHARPGKEVTLPIWSKTGRIRFQLLDSTRGEPLETPFTRIYSTKIKPDALVEVARSTAKTPQFDLQAGSYLAHIVNSHAHKRYSFIIKAGEQQQQIIDVDQGDLAIILDKNSPMEKAALEIVRLMKKEKDKQDRSEFITEISNFSKDNNLNLSLNEGTYRLILRTAPTARAIIKDVTIKKGDLKTVRFTSKQSQVSFSISKRNDALSRHQIFWQLYDKNNRMIWQSTDPDPSLLLSRGTYKVLAEIGNDKYRASIRLKSGKPQKFDLSAKKINK